MIIYGNTTKKLRCQQHVSVFVHWWNHNRRITNYSLEVVFMIQAINQDLKIFGTFRRRCAASLASLWTLAPAGGRFPGWQHVYTCTIWLKLRLELQGDPILTSVLCIKGFNRLNNSDTCRIVHLPRKCRSCDFRLSGFLTLPDTNQFSVTPTTSAQIQLMIDVTTWKCWKSSDWLVYIKHFYSHQTFDPVTRVHVNMANVSRHCCWCIPGKVWQKAFMCEHAVILLKRTLRSSTSQSRQRGPVTVLPLPVTHQTSTVHRRSRQSEAAHQAVMHIMNLYHGGLKST